MAPATLWYYSSRSDNLYCLPNEGPLGLIIDKYDEDVKGLGGGLDKSLYILTNLHLLGNDQGVMNCVSADFQKEVKKLETIGQIHAKKNKKQKLDSQDPLKVCVEQFHDNRLVTVLDFILEKDVCWEASSNFDMMIFKVPIPTDCLLEKCEYTQFYCDTMPVHIFGFRLMISGGEKQRIQLARVFLKDPPILAYDEATSALDQKTEGSIMNTIKAFLNTSPRDYVATNRTSIFIAHRLTIVADCDVIFFMDQGKVVESGSHEELIRLNG
jgi:ABC-type arginine transport system ATPase subunit